MKLMQTHHFCIRKVLLSNYLICLITLISHIAELLCTRKFCFFRPGLHMSLKYAQYNHLRCPMMGEVFLGT